MKRTRARTVCRSTFAVPFFLQPSPFLHGDGASRHIRLAQSRNTTRPSRTRGEQAKRRAIRASSLEDSKRRAKSQYDNIPDLNQQYLSELNWVERKYGPNKLSKDTRQEAQRSILRPDGAKASTPRRESRAETEGTAQADLRDYSALRNELVSNTGMIGSLGICLAWGVGSAMDAWSFALGLAGSLAYVSLLSRSVDRLAEGARTGGLGGGDALQPARVAVLVFLVLAAAKHPAQVSILPVLFGFFSYKVASLLPLVTGEAFE